MHIYQLSFRGLEAAQNSTRTVRVKGAVRCVDVDKGVAMQWVRVQIYHACGGNMQLLAEGESDDQGAFAFDVSCEQAMDLKGRLLAVAANTRHCVQQELVFDCTRYEPSGSSQSFVAPSSVRVSPKVSVSESPVLPPEAGSGDSKKKVRWRGGGGGSERRERVRPKPSPHREKAAKERDAKKRRKTAQKQQAKERPRVKRKPARRRGAVRRFWRVVAPSLGVFAFGGVSTCGLAGVKGFQMYEEGVVAAARVAEVSRTMPMIPVLHDDTSELITYLPSQYFVEYSADRWEMKPVPVSAVQPGGQLYLARQALAIAEDDWAETNLGWNPKSLNTIISSLGTKGGSNIHEQTCESVEQALDDSTPGYPSLSIPGVEDKFEDIFCGLGLGLGDQLPLDETFAGYFTFVRYGVGATGVMDYLDRYHGIYSLDDPEFASKPAYQILLAALPKYPYGVTPTNPTEQLRWEEIQGRAVYIADMMRDEGLLTLTDHADILADLNSPDMRPRPLVGSSLKHALSKPPEMAQVRALAQKELAARCAGVAVSDPAQRLENCQNWRRNNDHLYAHVDAELQAQVHDAVGQRLARLIPEARGTAFVTDSKGRLLAVHSGGRTGFDNLLIEYADRRLAEWDSPGSTGKLFIGVAFASMGRTPGDADLTQVKSDLARSRPDLENSSMAAGVDSDMVRQVLDCYGMPRGDFTPVQAAVSGNWALSPVDYMAFLSAVLTGTSLPEVHLLTGERNGGVDEWYSFDPQVSGSSCAALAYQGGRSIDWGTVPFTWTMRSMRRPSGVAYMIGKTGTTLADTDGNGDAEDETTNAIWAPFAIQTDDGENYMVMTRIRPEKLDVNGAGTAQDWTKDMGNAWNSTSGVVPLSKDILGYLTSP